MPRLTRVGVVTDRGPVGPWAERAGLGGLRHLVRRLRWSLRSHDFAPESEAALLDRMSAAETALYRRLSVVDRHHAVHNAAHCIDAGLGDELVVAAALHDVGKLEAGLGTSGRVLASLLSLGAGRERVASWRGRSGMLGRVGSYASHPELGAAMLAEIGSAPEVIAWARGHHRPLDEVDLEPSVAIVLWQADQD
jgi:hypothetical protein